MEQRIDREKRVINLMISRYCKDHHHSTELCKECSDLRDYAFKRLMSCPFAEKKPVCSRCTIHCYNKNQKEKIKEVMRYSGPKMIFNHPMDTLIYFFDKLRYKNSKIQISH